MDETPDELASDEGIRVTTRDPDSVVTITEEALSEIIELRRVENDAEKLALGLRVVGAGPEGFRYETAFVHLDDIDDGQLLEHHGKLPVVIPLTSVDSLRDATVAMSSDPSFPGLVIRNPNPPTPASLIEIGDLELTGSMADKVNQVLEATINPAIAAHGGIANLAGVDDTTVYLELGGGCQGCGLAALTLRQGIEVALKQAIPEITEVMDVTDHASGTNPFFEGQAK